MICGVIMEICGDFEESEAVPSVVKLTEIEVDESASVEEEETPLTDGF